MSAPYTLSTDRFAAWARTRGLALPDPIDITAVDAAGVDVPADVPALDHLNRVARLCTTARSSVFTVELVPGRGETVSVALGAERDAVLVTIGGGQVEVAATQASELVASLAARLPNLPALAQPHVQLAEQVWNDLLRQVATDPSPRSVAASLHRAGIGARLADAMLAAKAHPVPIGLLGASARIALDGPLQRGPTLASWFAYPDGAVLATLLAPRRGGPRTLHVEPYSAAAAVRALAEALPAAHRAVERAAAPT